MLGKIYNLKSLTAKLSNFEIDAELMNRVSFSNIQQPI